MTDEHTLSLIERIEESLAYFCDEFPKEKYPEVWSVPVSRHSGGMTPDDLQSILTMLYAANKPELKRGEIRYNEEELAILSTTLISVIADHAHNSQEPLRTKLCRHLRPLFATREPVFVAHNIAEANAYIDKITEEATGQPDEGYVKYKREGATVSMKYVSGLPTEQPDERTELPGRAPTKRIDEILEQPYEFMKCRGLTYEARRDFLQLATEVKYLRLDLADATKREVERSIDCREAFEQWYYNEFGNRTGVFGFGAYHDRTVQGRWQAWKAARDTARELSAAEQDEHYHWGYQDALKAKDAEAWKPGYDWPRYGLAIVRSALWQNNVYLQSKNGDVYRVWLDDIGQPMIECVAYKAPLPDDPRKSSDE